jgi:hypothetical protein
MVWVVHAGAHDKAKISQGIVMRVGQPPIHVVRSDACTLLRTWGGSGVPVYFDFDDGDPHLWRLSHGGRNAMACIMPVAKASFVTEYLAGHAIERTCNAYIAQTLNGLTPTLRPRRLSEFERYLVRKERVRPRF